jgi:hypothetical protein
MANTTSKTKPKRLSKGQRTHARRLKQAAGKEMTIKIPPSRPAQPVREQTNHDQA